VRRRGDAARRVAARGAVPSAVALLDVGEVRDPEWCAVCATPRVSSPVPLSMRAVQ